MRNFWLFLILLFVLPGQLLADDTSDVNSLIDRANQIVGRIHELQSLLGEDPGSRGVDLTTDEIGGEVKLTYKLILGSKDSTTGGEVSILQQFLYNQYYYDGPVSGVFSKATKDAVVDLQTENKQYLKITTGSGIVDGATRELIRRISVGETLDDTIASFSNTTVTPKPGTPVVVTKPKRNINIVRNGNFGGNILKPMEMSFTASGGLGGYTWKQTGTLPPGLTKKIDGDRLVIAGFPTDSGDFPIVVKATDKDGYNNSLSVIISVGPEIIEKVTMIRPTPQLVWVRNSYEVVGWRGPAGGTYDLQLNYFSTDCPNGVCQGLTPTRQATIASGVASRVYSWPVGQVTGGPVPTTGKYYSITVCEARTKSCDSSGGFRILDKGTDLTFKVSTDRYVYRAGETALVTLLATSKSSLKKDLIFPSSCQLNLRLLTATDQSEVYNSSSEEVCAQAETKVTITPFGSNSWSGTIKTKDLAPGLYLIKADIGANRSAETKITIQ